MTDVKYPGWDKQFIGGVWKEGSIDKVVTVTSLYNGEVADENKAGEQVGGKK